MEASQHRHEDSLVNSLWRERPVGHWFHNVMDDWSLYWLCRLRLSPMDDHMVIQIKNGAWMVLYQASIEYLYAIPILCYSKGTTQIWVSSLLETRLQKGFFFGSCCWRRPKIGIEPFTCSATQTWNWSCILGNVVEDSLKRVVLLLKAKGLESFICGWMVVELDVSSHIGPPTLCW